MTTAAQRTYREKELFAAVPLPPDNIQVGTIKIKITSHLGNTKWLNVTADEFSRIEAILTGKIQGTQP